MQDLQIAFIGAGNMAEALVAGLLSSGHPADKIMLSDIKAERLDQLTEQYGVETSQNARAVASMADVLVLAVKPQQMKDALSGLGSHIRSDATIISVAAGVSVESIKKYVGNDDAPVVRVMPNTPALVGAGMSVLFTKADQIHKDRSCYVMKASGETDWVEEEAKLHVITALSGSGPAYFFLLAEVMQAAAVSLGLSEKQAALLANQTAAGAGKMLAESGRTAADLRHQVTSPGGTTQAALDVMYEEGLPDTVRKAIAAATKRSKELGG